TDTSDDDLVSVYSNQLTLAPPKSKRSRLGVGAVAVESGLGSETSEGLSHAKGMSTRLLPAQRTALKSFVSLTQTNEKIALTCLQRAQFNVQSAVEHYYEHQTYYETAQPNGVKGGSKVKMLFDRYANDPQDQLPDKIGPNGIMRLLDDLGLDAEDRKVLVLAYKLNAEVQCEFSWEEWKKGMEDMHVDSVDSLRQRLGQIDYGLRDLAQFKPLYTFTFTYSKAAGQRNLDIEVALAYWKILFKDQFALFPLWEEFMTVAYKKSVTKDTWNLLFDFVFSIKSDLSNYDEEESWPVVLDDFVNWARPRINSGATQS
ncbi:hypothetical protein PFISCL1PPCAC_12586, partial [Pristionchus fissidentatus]